MASCSFCLAPVMDDRNDFSTSPATLPPPPTTPPTTPPAASNSLSEKPAPSNPSGTLLIAHVSLEQAGSCSFDYLVPKAMRASIALGHVVEAPLRGRSALGIVTSLSTKSEIPIERLKELLAFYQEAPPLKNVQQELMCWAQRHYGCSQGSLLKSLLPKAAREEKRELLDLYVKRGRTREALRLHILAIRSKKPAQASLLDCMLKVRSQIRKQELLEKTGCSHSSFKVLVEEGFLEVIKIPRFEERSRNYTYLPSKPKKLHEEQERACKKIVIDLKERRGRAHLLFGVTGSGKTEVFLHCIAQALKQQQQVIYLVPEIALTPQTTDRLRARFPAIRMSIWHSSITAREKKNIYEQLAKGEVDLLVGARSAIFAPMEKVGLLILDEEHDRSYKSQSYPYVHGRDLAYERARIQSCPLILASATPSLETLWRCKNEASKEATVLHRLRERASGTLPQITIVEKPQKELFAPQIIDDLRKNVREGNQGIIFLNRRGFFHFGQCKLCKRPIKCPHCDLSLTWHQNERSWHCHVCHLRTQQLPPCPSCKQNALIRKCGCGTEQVELALRRLIPGARILRLDRDMAKNAQEVEQILTAFRTAKADLLVGTQMVSKGHHFPMVTRCVIVDADAELAGGDFRGSEYFMQQLTQIAGRAGRGEYQGKVWIQSLLEDPELREEMQKQDYARFARRELEARQAYLYPPYVHLIHCMISSTKESQAKQSALDLANKLHQVLPSDVLLSEPSPSIYSRLQGRYRWSLVLKTKQREEIAQLLRESVATLSLPSHVQVAIDIDALSLS